MAMRQVSALEKEELDKKTMLWAARNDPIIVLLDNFYPNPRASNTLLYLQRVNQEISLFDIIHWDNKEVDFSKRWVTAPKQNDSHEDFQALISAEIIARFGTVLSWRQVEALAIVGEDFKTGTVIIPKAELRKLLALKDVKYVGAEGTARELFSRTEKLRAEIRGVARKNAVI